MKPRIVFLHIPKTAGTTLIERYWHNDNFCACDRETVNDHDVIFGHTAKFDKWDDVRPVVYVTALRNPVERIMSQYNFTLTQLTYMNPNNQVGLDFYTWFINKDQMRPMPYTSMIDFLNQCNGHWRNDIHEYDTMYSNQILHWDGEKTSINQVAYQNYTEIKRANDQRNYTWFQQNTQQRITHYINTNNDIVQEFESICDIHGIVFNEIRDINHTNVTSDTLKFQGSEMIQFNDLSTTNQQLVLDDVKYDMELYNATSIPSRI